MSLPAANSQAQAAKSLLLELYHKALGDASGEAAACICSCSNLVHEGSSALACRFGILVFHRLLSFQNFPRVLPIGLELLARLK